MAIVKISNKKNTLPDVVKITTSTGDVKIQKIKK
jgi:hypothetical protein